MRGKRDRGLFKYYKITNTLRIFLYQFYAFFVQFIGFTRCEFQKRMPIMLPNQEIFVSKKPDYYKSEDFYIGARLNLNNFIFEMISADIYALRYMELHCDKVQ